MDWSDGSIDFKQRNQFTNCRCYKALSATFVEIRGRQLLLVDRCNGIVQSSCSNVMHQIFNERDDFNIEIINLHTSTAYKVYTSQLIPEY